MAHHHRFPPVALSTIEERASAQRSRLIELVPFSDRPTPPEWRRLFHRASEADPRVGWLPAGLARCKPEERDATVAGLRDACEIANLGYQVLMIDAPPSQALDDRLTVENIAAVSTANEAYPILWP
jgi:hypothetical protein